MKIRLVGFAGIVTSQLAGSWVKVGAVLLMAAALCVGCSKKSNQGASTSQQTQSENSTPSQAATNTPTASQAVSPGAPAAAQPDLPELNRAMRRWLMANHRVPKNFDDFAATAGVPIPPPPAGKKYVLSKDMHVQLVDVK